MFPTRKLLATALMALTAFAADAQIFDKTRGKNVQALYNQPTNVYTWGNGAYNHRLRTAFGSHWNATQVVFHDVSKGMPELSSGSTVFMPVVVGLRVRDHETSMNHPFFVFAEAGRTGMVNGDGIVTAFPVNGFHYELDVTVDSMFHRSLLRVPYVVHTMNEMINYLKTNGNEKGYEKLIEERASRITGKTLLIPAELLTEWNVNPNTTALMKANFDAGKKPMREIRAAILEQGAIAFSGKHQILPSAEIMKLEQGADADKYTLFLPAINNKKYVMVFDLKTKDLLYFETTNMGMKIKEKDFEKLNKAMNR